MNLRILIPTIGLDNRGGTRICLELANRLARRGHQVKILVPRGSNKTTYIIDPNVVIKPVGFSIRQVEDVSSIMRLLMLFPLLEPCDVVMANYYLTAYPVGFSTLFKPRRLNLNLIQAYEPLVFGEAERTFPRLKKWLAETTYRFPMEQVAASRWVAEKVGKISKRPVRVIHPNIELDIFNPSSAVEKESGAVMAFPSHEIGKGWRDFVQAFSLLREKVPYAQARAASIADFPLPSGPFIAYHPISDADLVDLYRTSALYVHASWWEGCPLAPLEAMACGTPVVAAASEGILEYAVDGENCLLVPPKSPQALADAMARVLKDRALSSRLVAGGLETVKRFAWPRMVDEIEQLLLEKVAAR